MNKHTIHFILFSLARGITLPLLFLNSALLGRILGADGFGQWTMIIAASTMMHSLFFNWTYASGLRFGCEEWVKEHTLSRTWAARYPLLFAGLLIVVLLLIFQPFHWLLALFSVSRNLWWLVLAYAIGLWMTNELQTILQSTGQMKLLAFFSPVMAVFSLFFLLFLFLNPGALHDPVFVVAGQTTIIFAVCAALWFRGQKKQIFLWRTPDQADIIRHARYGWPLLPTFLVGYISMWGNYSILQAYHSSREVGLFGAAYQSMLGIISLNGILVTIVLPRMIAKNAESKEATRHYFKDIVPTLFCLWSLAIIALIAVIPSVFLAIFGRQFTDSLSMFIILLVVVPTSVLPHAYTVLFSIQQRLGRELLYSFVSMAASLIVSLCLIPAMGGRGAAVGAAAALLIAQVCTMWDQHRFMNMPLRRMGVLFSCTLILCVFQYVIGVNLWLRLAWGAASMFFLIMLFRQLRIVNKNLLGSIFSGHLAAIGNLLKGVLVVDA